jgi:phosphoglycolate phosphatase
MAAAFEAVLFDLDGTLLNTLEDLADSMNETLAALGLPQHPVEAYRRFVGDGVETLVQRAAPAARRDTGLRAELLAGLREQYAHRWSDKSRPYPGIPELLGALDARGVVKAVFSNKPHEFTLLCVSELLREWRFDAVYGLLNGIPSKPDPTGALRIADELTVPPSGFLYLGDTDTDMKTAIAAGMYPAGALWGFRSADELLAAGARSLVAHPLEVLALLDG